MSDTDLSIPWIDTWEDYIYIALYILDAVTIPVHEYVGYGHFEIPVSLFKLIFSLFSSPESDDYLKGIHVISRLHHQVSQTVELIVFHAEHKYGRGRSDLHTAS